MTTKTECFYSYKHEGVTFLVNDSDECSLEFFCEHNEEISQWEGQMSLAAHEMKVNQVVYLFHYDEILTATRLERIR